MRAEGWPDFARCRRKVGQICQPEDQNVDLGTTKMIARKEGGIGWMIVNQPEKHNAVSLEMWAGGAEDRRPHSRPTRTCG